MSPFSTRKRKALVIEDNELNKEILVTLLEDEFEVLTASDGEEGLRVLADNYRELSLIFLDVYMPKCNGFEFLERVRNDALLRTVPIIVTTGSNSTEDEAMCLDLGASDFVSKPYNPKVVKGRAHSIIKLKESVATLSAVEYDEMTGCYTLPAFYHHVEEMIKSGEYPSYDIFSSDIKEFKVINSVYGEKTAEKMLQVLVQMYFDYMPSGIVARQADQMFVFYPSKYRLPVKSLDKFFAEAAEKAGINNLVIKCGIYKNVDLSLPVSVIMDRVLIATAEAKGDPTKRVAAYNDEIGLKSIRNKKYEADFEDAIKYNEFQVWFQPKINTKTEKIEAAEALVRWVDKDGNMISPGEFIPLFEKDGLIHILDEYVFKMVCEFQKERYEAGKPVVPISVNLSRSSAYHESTVEHLANIIKEANIPMELIPIELTESASQEGARIRAFAETIRKAGFHLHMDDFGSGYSSLSSLGTIAFNELKIDKSLIDQIGTERGNIVLRHSIVIAQELGMRVVAEGVEEKNQVIFLRENGCDMIQGFYYSPPKKQSDFEEIINDI